TDELLKLPFLQLDQVKDSLHAYQLSKRANSLRVMAEAVRQQGLQTSCLHGGWWGGITLDGGQGEALRVPQADGTLVVLPVGPDPVYDAANDASLWPGFELADHSLGLVVGDGDDLVGASSA